MRCEEACEPHSDTSRFFRFQQLSSDDAGLNRLVARSVYVDGGPDRFVDTKWRQFGSGHERETHTHTANPKCDYRIAENQMHSHGRRLHRSHAHITAVTSMAYNVQSMFITINPGMPQILGNVALRGLIECCWYT